MYVGGGFETAGGISANNIAKYSTITNTWSALGSGLNGSPYALALIGSDLYVGGWFSKADGFTVNNIAKYSTTNNTWSALGSGMNNLIYTLAVYGDELYAGGYFTTPANKIAKWSTLDNAWSALGTENSEFTHVFVLKISGSDLYAGGSTQYGSPTFKNIAKYSITNNTWSALGTGVNSEVRAITVDGSNVYVGGYFTTAGGNNANRIAKWNGSSWSNLGDGILTTSNGVLSLLLYNSNLYIGGIFHTAGGVTANNIAKYSISGENYSSLTTGGTNGTNGNVNAIAIIGSDYYFGGEFTSVKGGTLSANRIAKWNATEGWSALGSGLNNWVKAFAVMGTDLYVGGDFTEAGGISANRITKWNATEGWSALGSGLNSTVNALAVSGTELYVGGGFTTAGGISANHIAKWNGSWSALGGGSTNKVSAIAIKTSSEIYIGCEYDDFKGSGDYILKWNGLDWSTLGLGVNSTVNAIAISGTNLYVGGEFYQAGGKSAYYIAKWDGSNWSALGNGVSTYVKALAVSGSDVYVGGNFTKLGDNTTSANYLVKWNETTGWSTLTEESYTGVSNPVNALFLDANSQKMIVGGGFVSAGSKGVYRIASFTDSDNPFPVELTTFTATVLDNKVNLFWTTTTEINNYGFYIERKIDDNNWEELNFVRGYGNSQVTNEYNYQDKIETSGIIKYRLKQVDLNGEYKYSSIVEVEMNMPISYSLAQNYPNPFNPETTINYSIAKQSNVKIVIYDALGKEVTTLINENKNAGNHFVIFNASNLTSGVYFYKIETADFINVKKMVFVK